MIPEAMSRAARERAERPPSVRVLLAMLSLLVVLGVVGTTASILNARTTQAATREDVERNARLLERLRDLEAVDAEQTEEHRVRNEALHADLCRLIYEVIQAAPTLRDKGIRPCRPALHTPGGG